MQCRFYHAQSRLAVKSLLQFLEKIQEKAEASIIIAPEPDKLSKSLWQESTGDIFVGHDVIKAEGEDSEMLKTIQHIVSTPNVDGTYATDRHIIYYDSVPALEMIPKNIKSLAVIFLQGMPSQDAARGLWKQISSNDDFDAKYFQQDAKGKWAAK